MEKPIIKDKNALAYIEHLENKLRIYTDSPYTETYISIKKIVNSINSQIQKIDINIDSEDSAKTMKKVTESTEQLGSYIKVLDSLQAKMNPADVVAANLEAKKMLTKDDGVEQFLNEQKA
jgi:Zn-dependent oligopeptidase